MENLKSFHYTASRMPREIFFKVYPAPFLVIGLGKEAVLPITSKSSQWNETRPLDTSVLMQSADHREAEMAWREPGWVISLREALETPLTIGRDQRANLIIPLPSLSPIQGTIATEGDEVYYTLHPEGQPTLVNERPAKEGETVHLKNGDTLQFGPTLVFYMYSKETLLDLILSD